MNERPSSELWRLAWALSDDADGLEPEQLDAWLAEACRGDLELERAVRDLLTENEPEGPSAAAAPDHIGPYTIGELIGTGGLGRVFRARHLELDRDVAIKLLPLDPFAAGDLERAERFKREVQTLARLDHPGIVRIIEAGNSADAAGGPVRWFAMELVEGARTLAEYVREVGPTRAGLIELAAEIAEAVGYAHAQGVLHRDLKPSNLLVDSGGRARVIDFGIAQTTEARAVDLDLTRAGSLVGTLNYLAPERLDGERADARSDVYALGLVLEEAVSGKQRFDYSSTASGLAALREAQQLPARPVAREVSLPTELDWIIAKATDPTPGRRYADAKGLAADLRRLASHQPLVASPLGRAYRARLFVLRNRGPVTAAAALLGVLLAGLVATSAALVRESRALTREEAAKHEIEGALRREQSALVDARASAETALREAHANAALADFFRGAFERAPARDSSGAAYSIDAALADASDQARALILQEHDPQTRARVLSLVGSVFARRLLWERAAELLGEATDAFSASGTTWTEGWLGSVTELHRALVHLERDQDAMALEEELLHPTAETKLEPVRRLKALNDCFIHWARVDRHDVGLRLLEAIHKDADLEDPAQRNFALTATHNLAALTSAEDAEQAIALYLEVWDWRSEHEPEINRTYRSVNGAGDVLIAAGRIGEGIALLDHALELAAAHGLARHEPDIINLLETKSKGLVALGRSAEAVLLLEHCLTTRRLIHGNRDLDVLDAMSTLALCYGRLGRTRDALELSREEYELGIEERGFEHYKNYYALGHMGLMELRSGNVDEALAILEEAYRGLERVRGPAEVETVSVRTDQIFCLTEAGFLDEAQEAQLELIDELERASGASPIQLALQYDNLGLMLQAEGRTEEAVEVEERAVAGFAALDALHPLLVIARGNLAAALVAEARVLEARTQLELATEEAERLGVAAPPEELVERVAELLGTE